MGLLHVTRGVGEGAATGLLFAALFPERVRAVVCVNGTVRMLHAPDYPGGIDPAFLDGAIDRIRKHWGEALFVDAEAPSRSDDPEFRTWFSEYLRSATAPGNAIAQLKLNALVDARWILPHLRLPVLVLHRADNRLVRAADGRYIADNVPGARYVELPGGDHLPFTGDTGALLNELRAFLRDARLDAPPARPIAPVAVVRASAPDAPGLRLAAERFDALGARRLPCDDPRALIVTSPWFGKLALATVSLSSDPTLAASLSTVILDEGAAAELASRLAASSARSPGECVASESIKQLCVGLALRFEALDAPYACAAWRVSAAR